MKRFKYIIISLLLCGLIAFSIFSCKHDIIYPSNYGYNGKPNLNDSTPKPPVIPPAGNPCSPDTVYFESQVLPLFVSFCANCHSNFNNYSNIKHYVVAGKPNSSSIYQSITGSEDIMPPKGNPKLSSDQISLINKWITQGAKDLTCDYCDTSKYTFSGAVFPTIQAYCIGCHSGSVPNGNVNLSGYSLVKAIADNGKLVCTITHSSGCFAMPPTGNKIPDCQISQIKNWIKNGAKND